jgi:hypothetical protein
LVAAAMSLTTLFIGARLRSSALLAAEPLAIIQGRLAASLGIQELRIVERHINQNVPIWIKGTVLPPLIASAALAACIGASLYAWIGHLRLTSRLNTVDKMRAEWGLLCRMRAEAGTVDSRAADQGVFAGGQRNRSLPAGTPRAREWPAARSPPPGLRPRVRRGQGLGRPGRAWGPTVALRSSQAAHA